MRRIPYGHQSVAREDIDEVIKVLRSDWITQGPKIAEFEKALAKYCGSKYAVCVSSGTAALHLACLAAGLKKGDEAITTPMTFVATPNSIVYTGAKPVFADIDNITVNISPGEIKKKITRKTKAVLPVHFAGLPCDMEEIAAIARTKKLTIIEDCSHALGAEYRYRGKWLKVGSCKHSDMAVFSFHPVKSITTGEGGAILTNRKDLYEKLIMLRQHGITKEKRKFINNSIEADPWYYQMQELGFNYRITDFQAALGISQLKKLNEFIRRRRELASIYSKELSAIDALILPKEPLDKKSSWHIYPIRLKKPSRRKELYERLRESGIGVQVHYIPVHMQPYYMKSSGSKKGDYPNAERYYESTITLPIYPAMTYADIRYVIKVLKGFN